MKYFTPDLLARFASNDRRIAQEAHDELERRSGEYLGSLDEIEPRLPPRFREFLNRFYLHDARVITRTAWMGTDLERIERSLRIGLLPESEDEDPEGRVPWTPSLWIPLQLDTPPRETLVLQYRFVRVEQAQLHQSLYEECPELEWLYDEVDVAEDGETLAFRHSILFTRGLELRLQFKDFDYATLSPMDPVEELAELNRSHPLA